MVFDLDLYFIKRLDFGTIIEATGFGELNRLAPHALAFPLEVHVRDCAMLGGVVMLEEGRLAAHNERIVLHRYPDWSP